MKSRLINKMSGLDNYIIDNSPLIDKFLKDYNKHFTYEWLINIFADQVINTFPIPIMASSRFLGLW